MLCKKEDYVSIIGLYC